MRSTIFSEIKHDAQLTIKKLAAFTLLALAVMLVLIPLSTSAVSEFSIFNVEYTHQQLKFRIAADGAVSAAGFAAFLIGVVIGTMLFSFVSDRKKSAFYFSLGLSRGQLFTVRAAAGTAALLLINAVPVVISVILNCKALGCYNGLLSYAAAFFTALFFQSLCGMIIFSASCLLSGTLQEALCAGITLLAAPSVCIFFVNILMKNFTWGNIYGEHTYAMAQIRPSLTEICSEWNPLFMSQSSIEKYNSFSREMSVAYPEAVNRTPFIVWALIIVIGIAAAAALFTVYKAEKSGIEGLFCFTNIIVCTVWPVAAFSVCMEYTSMLSAGMSFAVSAASAAIAYATARKLLRFGNNGRGSAFKGGAVLAVLFIAASAAAVTGGGGIFYTIPGSDEIENVEVVYTGQLSYASSQSGMTSKGMAKYYNGRMTLSSDECVSIVKELDSMMQKQGRIKFSGENDFQSTAFPYDLQFTYNLRSGKKIERYYDRITAEGLGKFLKLYGTDEVRLLEGDVVKGLMSGSLWNSAAFADGDIYISDGWLSAVKKINLSSDYRDALLAAAAEDIFSMNEEELYHPVTDAVAVIMFTLDGEDQLEAFAENNATAVIYLTESWKRTIEVLKEWNIMPELSEPEISDVYIQKLEMYSAVNGTSSPMSLCFTQYSSVSDDDFILSQDFGNRPDITDEKQISELADASRGYYYMDKGGYLLAFRMADSGAYVYRFMPYDDAPEFIKVKMQ